MDYLKKKEELQNKINEIDTYLKKKEELENKINFYIINEIFSIITKLIENAIKN